MPRPSRHMAICGRSDVECVKNVKREIRLQANDSFTCKCPYGCHAIKYDMSLSATPIFAEASFMKTRNLTARNTGILHVYYQSSYYRSHNKEELIGFTEFLCNYQFNFFF